MKFLERCYYALRDWASKPAERGSPSGGYWHAQVRDTALELCVTRRGRLLEIGCGEGLFLSELAQRQPALDVWGLDNAKEKMFSPRSLYPREAGLLSRDAGRCPTASF